MHLKRITVAAVLLPLLYLYIMFLPAFYFLSLMVVITILAMSEFYSMYHVPGILRYACTLGGVFTVIAAYAESGSVFDIIVLFFMIILIIRLFYKKDPSLTAKDLAAPVIGFFYIPCLLLFQVFLRDAGPEWIILLYASVWVSDSMAYYIGKGIGRRKLYREMSPNKTVAGAFGSVLGGTGALIALRATLVPSLSLSYAIWLGAGIGFITIAGDLIESMFKRDAGVKDSGVIIPGHGGILDKIDGALFTGPFVYWSLSLTGVLT